MKQFTQEEFDNFEIRENRKICPSGDYSLIKIFDTKCSFGEECSFGERCSFGEWCSFGEGCSFGEECSFGKWCSFGKGCFFGKECSFGEGCSFGKWCSFGKDCSFGEECSFGEWCSFGEECSFGKGCSFGERCSFGEECSFENLKFNTEHYFIRINNIGSREDGCYIFNSTDGIYVRSGCFFGNEDEFLKQVTKKHEQLLYEKQYYAAIKFAKISFGMEEI
jgi:NDP-sugar pyrophosphorylase family protein